MKKLWFVCLKMGFVKMGLSIIGVFVNMKIDEDLYEEFEIVLLMFDVGVDVIEYLFGVLCEKVCVGWFIDL